jgi:hypothetical protein
MLYRLEMLATRDENYVLTGQSQLRAKVAACPSSTKNDKSHPGLPYSEAWRAFANRRLQADGAPLESTVLEKSSAYRDAHKWLDGSRFPPKEKMPRRFAGPSSSAKAFPRLGLGFGGSSMQPPRAARY